MKTSPYPWRHEDYEGRGLKIVDRDGEQLAVVHYPTSVQAWANLNLMRRAPELLKRLKDVHLMLTLTIQGSGGKPAQDATIQSINSLIADVEGPPPKSRESERP